MKPMILAAMFGGVLLAAGPVQAKESPRKVKPGAVVLQLYYNTQAAAIIRSNNVQQVTNPSAGTYCIAPIKPVDAHTVYPVASAEYITSAWVPNGGYVVWQDTTVATDCPAGDLEVRTVYGGGVQPLISFSLVVFQ